MTPKTTPERIVGSLGPFVAQSRAYVLVGIFAGRQPKPFGAFLTRNCLLPGATRARPPFAFYPLSATAIITGDRCELTAFGGRHPAAHGNSVSALVEAAGLASEHKRLSDSVNATPVCSSSRIGII
jgi:hypothetical protein